MIGAGELADCREADLRTQHALLWVVIDELPCVFTVPELVREVGPKERDAVERAVTDLVGVGLFRREDASVLPTRAALYFGMLESVVG